MGNKDFKEFLPLRIKFVKKAFKYISCCKCKIFKCGINCNCVLSFLDVPINYYSSEEQDDLYSTPCLCLLSADLEKKLNRSLENLKKLCLKVSKFSFQLYSHKYM